jgi:hypothetical protein
MSYQPEIKQGVIVHHPKFGKGKVSSRFGEDEKSKVVVKFVEEGEKKLSLKYAKLQADIPEPEEAPASAEPQA